MKSWFKKLFGTKENYLNKVEEFYKAFKQDEFIKDGYVSRERGDLRFELMAEENDEYLRAVNNNDLIEIADALGDMLYILCGTILEHNLQDKIEDVFNEIQISNMSKLDSNGDPVFREDGKIIKGENYFPPNLKKVLDI